MSPAAVEVVSLHDEHDSKLQSLIQSIDKEKTISDHFARAKAETHVRLLEQRCCQKISLHILKKTQPMVA